MIAYRIGCILTQTKGMQHHLVQTQKANHLRNPLAPQGFFSPRSLVHFPCVPLGNICTIFFALVLSCLKNGEPIPMGIIR